MSDLDAMLAAIVADPGEDTPKLALADFCDDTLGSETLAKLVRAKIDLLPYRPMLGRLNEWFRNTSQAADDLRMQIKWLEADLLEDEYDDAVTAIEQTFLLVAFLTRKNRRVGWTDQETRVSCRDMLRQTVDVELPGYDEPPPPMVNEGYDDDDDEEEVPTDGVPRPFQQFADQYTDVGREDLIARMREAAARTEFAATGYNFIAQDRRRSFVFSPPVMTNESTDATVAGEVPPPGSD